MQWIVEVDERIPYKDDSMWYWNLTDEVVVGFACERYWIDIIPRGNIRIETPGSEFCGMGCSGDCDGTGNGRGECEMNHFIFSEDRPGNSSGKLTWSLMTGPHVKERNHFEIEVIDIKKARDAFNFIEFGYKLDCKNSMADAVELAVEEMARLDKDV